MEGIRSIGKISRFQILDPTIINIALENVKIVGENYLYD